MTDFDELKYIPLGEDKSSFHFFYESMKIYFHNNDPKNPNLTDHGELHIKNVMRNANRLLEKDPFDLHRKDCLYLMQAICIHDLAIGNFEGCGREDHNNKIFATFPEILDKVASVKASMTERDSEIICRIAASHSGNAKETYDYIVDHYSITSTEDPHVLFLAMLLRVADELDISQERLKGYSLPAILPNMEAESQLHWIKHESIVYFKLSYGDKANYLGLFLKPDMLSWLDNNRDKLKIKFKNDEYLEFMRKAIIKLKNELESVCEYCGKIEDKSNWKLRNVTLNVSANNHDSSGYIEELNRLIISSNNTVEEKGEIKAYDCFDNKIKEEKEKKNIVNENNNDNVLIKEKIPIFTINDTYKYIVCPIEKQENCPVYISNGDKCNKQAYK